MTDSSTNSTTDSTNESPTDSTLRARRRWRLLPRFGLRTLLVLMLVIPLACWLYNERIVRLREMEQVFLQAGGSVQRKTNGPAWLRKWTGDEFFQTIVEVDLRHAEVTDDCLMWLTQLDSIEELRIGWQSPGTASIESYRGLAEVEYLNLNGLPITDRGLSCLRGSTDLRTLFLNGTEVSDAGLIHLQSHDQLRFLWLVDTQVTSSGVKQLAQSLPEAYIGH